MGDLGKSGLLLTPRADDEPEAKADGEVVDARLPGKASKLQL